MNNSPRRELAGRPLIRGLKYILCDAGDNAKQELYNVCENLPRRVMKPLQNYLDPLAQARGPSCLPSAWRDIHE